MVGTLCVDSTDPFSILVQGRLYSRGMTCRAVWAQAVASLSAYGPNITFEKEGPYIVLTTTPCYLSKSQTAECPPRSASFRAFQPL